MLWPENESAAAAHGLSHHRMLRNGPAPICRADGRFDASTALASSLDANTRRLSAIRVIYADDAARRQHDAAAV